MMAGLAEGTRLGATGGSHGRGNLSKKAAEVAGGNVPGGHKKIAGPTKK